MVQNQQMTPAAFLAMKAIRYFSTASQETSLDEIHNYYWRKGI